MGNPACVAERVGFEPTVPVNGTHALQACPFDRSGTSPQAFYFMASVGREFRANRQTSMISASLRSSS